jgi:hypothetical protein
MSSQVFNCDNCLCQMPCRNIYVAFKILTEELRWAERPDLEQRFSLLKAKAALAGYAYPHGGGSCALNACQGEALAFVDQAYSLLYELRRNLRLSY